MLYKSYVLGLGHFCITLSQLSRWQFLMFFCIFHLSLGLSPGRGHKHVAQLLLLLLLFLSFFFSLFLLIIIIIIIGNIIANVRKRQGSPVKLVLVTCRELFFPIPFPCSFPLPFSCSFSAFPRAGRHVVTRCEKSLPHFHVKSNEFLVSWPKLTLT